jgi:hypothetical protein
MSDLTKRTSPPVGVDPVSAQRCVILSNGLQAGVALTRGDACYIDSNSLVQKAVTTVNSPSTGTFMRSAFDGIVGETYISGAFGVTLYGQGAIFGYAASGLTVGTHLWASATAGKIADAKVATNDEPIAKVISATEILVIR